MRGSRWLLRKKLGVMGKIWVGQPLLVFNLRASKLIANEKTFNFIDCIDFWGAGRYRAAYSKATVTWKPLDGCNG